MKQKKEMIEIYYMGQNGQGRTVEVYYGAKRRECTTGWSVEYQVTSSSV